MRLKKTWKCRQATIKKISFGGIPNVLFLQIFLKRAAKPSAGHPLNLLEPDLALHQRFPQNLLRELLCNLLQDPLNLTWLCTKASQELLRNLLRNPVEPDLALHQSLPGPSPNLLRNILWNLVEPNLALHQSLPHLLRNILRNLLRNPVLALHQFNASHTFSVTFSGTFSGTLLHVTWLCTNSMPPRPSPEPSPKPCSTDLALHQRFLAPPRPSPEPSLEPCWTCWTWLGFAPWLPGTFSGFQEPCWTWPVSAPNPRPSREPSEPSPEPRWTWPGACASAHRSYWAEDPVSLRCWGKTADLCADPCCIKSVEVQDTRSWKSIENKENR